MSEEVETEPVARSSIELLNVFPSENVASLSNAVLAKNLVHDIIGTGKTLTESSPNSEKKCSINSEVSVDSVDNQDGIGSKEQTGEGSENAEDLASVHSRELKSILALSKEAKLDTNISRKRKSSDYKKKSKLSESSPKQGVTPKSMKVFHENRNIRYPVTAESELELDFNQEDSSRIVDNSSKIPKRKKTNVSDATVGGATEENTRRISRKSLTSSEILMFKPNKDMFCWRCHRDGVNISCETCVRSYHQKCLKQTIGDAKHWPCPECVSILKAESTQTRSEAMRGMTLEHLCGLLKFAVNRMKQCPNSEPFIHPVNDADFPEYKKYIIQPMDLTLLEKNIKENLYGSTQAFEADAKWILHNSIIFNSYQSKLTNVAKNIIKVCKQEMAEIENCPSCYLNANTKKNTWFTEVCPKPHLLVWAKLRGFPYWPGKAMSSKDGMVDVRFFGAHDKAWVPEKECYLYCQKDPNSFKQKRNDIEACVKELTVYVDNLKKIYGNFQYAPFKTPLDPQDELKQLQIFLPNYKASNTKSKFEKRHSVDVKDVSVKGKEGKIEADEKKKIPETVDEKEADETEEFNSNNNKDPMDGYGTDDDTLPEIDTERRNMLRYKNDKDNTEIDNGIEEDEDDTQVPSNIEVDSTASRGNIKTKGFSNFTGQLKFIPHRSFEAESSSQKRHTVDDRIISPTNPSRRNSEASTKSDSSRLSNISDKINRVDIPENMEISLGNDDAGGVSISENVSSSNSECSKSDNEFSVEIKKKPIQVDIENKEFTISPASKLKISDKLMKKLSDGEDSQPFSSKDQIEEVKRNVLAKKKDVAEINEPSISSHEEQDPTTSTTTTSEEALSHSNNETEELMDTMVHTTVSSSKINSSLSPNFIEEMASINSISSLPPTQLMEDSVVDSSNDQETVESTAKIEDVNKSVISEGSAKGDTSKIEEKPLESEDESDDEVLSKFVNKDKCVRKVEQTKSTNITVKKAEKIDSEPPKKKVCILASPKNEREVNKKGDIKEPAENGEQSVEGNKEETRAAFEKNISLKVLLGDSDSFIAKENKKVYKENDRAKVSKPKTYEGKNKSTDVSKTKDLGGTKLTACTKKPTVLLIKKANVEKKVSELEKDVDNSVKGAGRDKTEEDSESVDETKKVDTSPKKLGNNDGSHEVNDIIHEFQDEEDAEALGDIHIDKANIINIIHSSLKEVNSKTSSLTEEKADSPSKKTSTENGLENKKRKGIEGEIDTNRPQKRILRFIPIETILSGQSTQPETNSSEKETSEEASNPILLKSLQSGGTSPRKSSCHIASPPSRSLSNQSSVQEFLTDEVKSEPESETDNSEPENLEAKKKYLSALNILEKTYEKEKTKPHEIRTRSKTEEKREKFKVVDNLTRVIDHVAVNFSAQHDGEALPPAKKSESRKPQTQVQNKPEGEIFVKSFAKIIPKQRARKSFPSPNYAKPVALKPAPEVKCSSCTGNSTEPTTTVVSSVAGKVPTSIISSPAGVQQQNVQKTVMSPTVHLNVEPARAFLQNGTQPQMMESIRTTNGYIILQQPPVHQQEVMLLPPNQTISYTTTGVSIPSQVLHMAPGIVSNTPSTIRDPNVTSSQNYIPQNESSPQNPPVLAPLPSYKPPTASTTTTAITLPPPSTSNTTAGTSLTNSVVTADDREASVSMDTTPPQVEMAIEGDGEDLGLLNSLVPGNVTRAVTELLRRPPPKLKPRPPGVLSTSFCEGLPSTAGSVSAKINSVAHRFGDYFRGMLIETLDDLGKSQCPEAVISSLKLELEALKHKHNIELSEIEKNITTVLKDIQRSIVEDRERIVEETRAACEAETIKRIEEAKSKQWCANCCKEAQFYCCWNTSYCDYPCQQKHWPQHMNKCTQNANGSSVSSSPAGIRPPSGQQLILRPANPPPKGGVGRIFTKPVQKVYMNRANPGPKTMKVQTTSGTQLTVMETTPGNYQVVGGPITMRSSPTYTTLKTSNIISVSSSSSHSNQSILKNSTPQKTTLPKPTTTRVISHTIPVTTVLDEDSE